MRRFALPLGLSACVLAPGACDCGPEPVDEIICDFTLTGRDGDRIEFGSVEENGGTRNGAIVIANTGNRALGAFTVTFGSNGEQYALEIPDGTSIAPGDNEAFAVVFAPTLRSILNSELQISHPAFGGVTCPVRTLTLLGEGVEAPPVDAGVDAGFDDAGVGELDDAGLSDGGFVPAPDGGIELGVDAVWHAYGGFEEARAGFATVALADGTVLAVGGWGENGTVLNTIERFDPTTGRSAVVGTMAIARAEPGAVALDGNRIAIVGGRSARTGGVVLRTVEVFNVATGEVSCPGTQAVNGACTLNTQGFLPAGRVGPVVTALGLNEIVVALGRTVDADVEVALAGGDVVNLTTGNITPISGLAARTDEARLVDIDGSFLVVGGRNIDGSFRADSTRFDTATRLAGTGFTLAAGRAFSTLTHLDGDRALLIGGADNTGTLTTDALVIESPFTSGATTSPLTTAFTPRISPAVSTLPGDIVIVAGGLEAFPADDDDDSLVPSTSAEVLVPFGVGFARFAPDNDLAMGRIGGGIVVDDVNNTVTYLGGFGTAPRRTPQPHAEQYRLTDNVFASFGLMGPGAAHVAAALPTSGAALVAIGGIDPHTGATSSRSRAFDAEHGLFLEASPLLQPRRDHSATSIAVDLAVVIGGRDETGAVLNSASILNVNGDDVALPVTLRRARAEHTATLLPGDGPAQILVCGGVGTAGEALDSCELFTAPGDARNVATYASSSFVIVSGRMATGRIGHSATLLDGNEVLLVGGGDVERAQVAADLYLPDTNTVVRTGVPDRARRHHAAVALGGGRVLVVGGEVFEGGLGPSKRAEVYARGAQSFTVVDDMRQARLQPAAFLLGDGNVLVAGGTASLEEPGFPTISVVESELYVADETGLGTFETIELPLSFGRSDLVQADVFGRAVVVGGTHRDGVVRGGSERRSPQHFVDMLESTGN